MQPLARQQTRASIYSWWSDSNPGLRGPTINLHTVAKPLMKLMYHRQVREIIRKNRDSPLSSGTLEIYSSYFPWNFVSWWTKAAILWELARRAEASEVEARVVVDSPIFPLIVQLLESPNSEARSSSCRLLGYLAQYESTAPAILKLKPSVWLVSLLRNDNSDALGEAVSALFEIARWSDGAQAVVDAKTTDYILILLQSSYAHVRETTCELVGVLASQESTAPAILELKPHVQLVSLLSDDHSSIVRSAMHALAKIARWPDGAQAVVDAKATDHILILLQSSDAYVRKWTCKLVRWLAYHESTASAILGLKLYVQLVSLLHDDHSAAIGSAMYALSKIARWTDGAQAVVDAKATDHILILLQSSDAYVRKWTCELVGWLASHESTAPAILELKLYVQLVSLLSDDHSGVIGSAMCGLANIARWLDGAQAVVDAKAMDHTLILLQSSDVYVRKWTGQLVGWLASHESTAPAILGLKLYVQLVFLLCDGHSDIVRSAMYALSEIARWADGAQAVVDAKATDHILILLQSSNPYVRKWTCQLVGWLASHESTAPAILKLEPCLLLASLLHDHEVIEWAANALTQLAAWSDGAQAIVHARALDRVLELLQSSNPSIQGWSCKLVGWLASHEPTAPAIMKLAPSPQLVSLLPHPDADTREAAIFALAAISGWPKGCWPCRHRR
ncbi:hypothetical protein MVEN_01025500 [Mycena venus]|uniref:ARM repeat-containing protein n=1 Tax=Mycena venus TaxID=2733690 RepID=A0A8H6YD07_9AGAR|nr:hypothetical protein MVEN_01025500 [Mycena venus]